MASARPTAVLDACVLVPRALRDLLLSCADTGVFRPVWEHEIEDEMIRNQVRLDVEKGRDKDACHVAAEHAREQMNRAFPDARLTTEVWVPLVGQMTNATKDRHVLAAAVGSGASRLVTLNLRDFPDRSLPSGIEVQHPDRFLLDQLARDEYTVISALVAMAGRHVRAPRSPAALAQAFASGQFVPRFGAAVLDKI
ncbi:PIN domain-containing protein [Nocardioides sp. NPDC047086]|uniref:PIN domain-containing protein n=1 Tax=Nocardioides sp. NPDC047086 TaxID=3154810 RepID=UPI00341130B1